MSEVFKRVPKEARVIGQNLRNLRQHAGLTQKDLAKILGITFQQVQKYERGENRFPVEKLHVLKNYYDVPYHVFFMGLSPAKNNAEPWPKDLCKRLAKVPEALLQDKIERVVSILME